MKNVFGLITLFILSLSMSFFYQSCGESSIQANSSGKDGLQVVVTPDNPDGPDGGGDGNGGNTSFSIELGKGDNIFYLNGGGLSLNLRSARIYSKLFSTNMESIIYHPAGTVLDPDLSSGYCADSALPHCQHIDRMTCLGIGCHEPNQPIRCHWQKRLSGEEINTALQAINSMFFITREVTPADPMMSDCNDPRLFFYTSKNTFEVSLTDKVCVPDGQFFASQGADAVKGVFNAELNRVQNLTMACNNFATYVWNSTEWKYRSNSGFTTALNSQFREIDYKNAKSKIRYKNSGNAKTFCNPDVFVNPAEVAAFFPASGINYEVLITDAQIADAPVSEITYKNVGEEGDWHFLLDQVSAQTYRGGAIISEAQAMAIKQAVEVLVTRAQSLPTTVECP